MPREFIDVLAERLADYTGRDWREARSVVRDADDGLADQMADLMLADVREHVGDAHAEYQSARRRLVDAVGPALRAVSPGVGTDVQQRQQARADAERVFAAAVDVAHPVAVAVQAPRAKELVRAAQIADVRATLRGLPADRMPTVEQVGEWLDRAEQADGFRREFVVDVGSDLLLAAGDRNYDPLGREVSTRRMLQDGVARAWVRQRLPEVTAALGRPMEPGDEELLPYGFRGGMADGLAQAIGDRTGRPRDEVLDRLCVVGDLSLPAESDQWEVARQLLVPDAAMEHVDVRDRKRAIGQVRYRMEDQLAYYHEDPARLRDLTPQQAGAAIATTGADWAGEWGARLPEPPTPPEHTNQLTPDQPAPEQAGPEQVSPGQQDPALRTALNAAFVPGAGKSPGRPEPAPATQPGATGTPVRQATRQPGTRPGTTPGAREA
ncbi:hypothetical protein GCM10010522_71940 [Kribbella solani]